MSDYLAHRVIAHREAHHRGRENAIPRERLLVEYVWLFERISDREWRRLYAEELPVCACQDGLFIPATTEEVLEFEKYLAAKIPPWKVRERIELIYRHYPKLRPEPPAEQMGLFGEGGA